MMAFVIGLVIFSSFKPIFFKPQEVLQVVAIYDGHEDYGYNFISENTSGDEITITFQEVEESVLDAFDLHSDALVGTQFKISYTTEMLVVKDADGYDDENEINTITKLEKL